MFVSVDSLINVYIQSGSIVTCKSILFVLFCLFSRDSLRVIFAEIVVGK